MLGFPSEPRSSFRKPHATRMGRPSGNDAERSS